MIGDEENKSLDGVSKLLYLCILLEKLEKGELDPISRWWISSLHSSTKSPV